MIEHLYVENVALIEKLDVNFGDGLNILTGETGAGKSIMIDSINFAMGVRPDANFIRNGTEYALVEITFTIKKPSLKVELAKLDANPDEYDMLQISRKTTATGKITNRINGKVVTQGQLKNVANLLIDIHSQHENQSLFNSKKHLILLDKYCPPLLDNLKNELSTIIEQYKKVNSKTNEILGSSKDKDQRIDILRYQSDEIEAANLITGEDETIREQINLLQNSEKLSENTANALKYLSGDDYETVSAGQLIGRAINLLESITTIDENKANILETLNTANVILYDVTSELLSYQDSLDFDPSKLTELDERLETIKNLKHKYGSSIEEILDYKDKIEKELEVITGSEELLDGLKLSKRKLAKEILDLCEKISAVRKESGLKLQEEIVSALNDLGMDKVKFAVSIERKKEFSNSGYDSIEFLISPNPGMPLMPLSKIASGGEISRIMLAIKTVLAKMDTTETFIFDEIDSGISGRTALKVAEKLSIISQASQLLCITHLPQIAAMGEHNFYIEKISEGTRTVTNVRKLSEKENVEELARLIGGTEITSKTLESSAEMLEQAKTVKLSLI